MAKLVYEIGDATRPQGLPTEDKVICHICNDVGAWGAGFVLAISRRWPEPEKAYRASKPALGEVEFVEVEPGLHVANMVAQKGVGPIGDVAPIRYPAVGYCLAKVAKFAIERNASVHMPRIGCGLAGGKWESIEPIIERRLVAYGIDVFVYDLPRASI